MRLKRGKKVAKEVKFLTFSPQNRSYKKSCRVLFYFNANVNARILKFVNANASLALKANAQMCEHVQVYNKFAVESLKEKSCLLN
jgi:hypothetical protein